MSNNNKVTILCWTYNHDQFIRYALKSFFTQKTNFGFQILIYDDASNDHTRDVIREYQELYPGRIITVFRNKNQCSKGLLISELNNLFSRINTNYISICEGDDYFSDDHKLQFQVDFLENNPEYSLCFHPASKFFEDKNLRNQISPNVGGRRIFYTEDLLRLNFMETSSVMYRRQNYDHMTNKNILPGDWYFHLYHAQFGKIGFINKVMSAHRMHAGGIWWDSHNNPDNLIIKNGLLFLSMYFELLKLFRKNQQYTMIIFENINILLNRFMLIDVQKHTRLLDSSFKKFPDQLSVYLHEYVKEKNKLTQYLFENNTGNRNERFSGIQEMDLSSGKSALQYRFWRIWNKFKRF